MATFIQWHFQPVEPKKDAITSHMRTIMGGDFHTVEQLENSKDVQKIYINLKEIEDLNENKKKHIPANVFTFITNFCEAYEEKNMKKWKILWSKWHHDHPFADFMIQKLDLIEKNKKFGEFSEVKSFEKLLNELRKTPQKAAREKAAREKAAREKAAKEKAAREKAAKEKAAKEKAAKEKAAKEKAAREKAAREKAAREKAAKEKAAREKTAKEKAAREKAAKEKAAKEKAAREKAAREKAAREKAAKEKAAREKAAREKAAREKAAREKAAKEKAAKEKAENIAKAKAKLKTVVATQTVVATHHKAAREKAAKTKHNTHSGLWDKIKAHGGLWHKIKATFNKCDATKGHTTLNQDRFENYTKFLIVDSIMDTKSLFDILKRQNDNIKIDDLVGYLEILWTKYKGDLNRMVRYGDDPQVLMVQMTRAVIRMVTEAV